MTKAKNPKVEDMNDIFKNYDGDTGGFSDMNKDTQSVPFLRLLQELSPQCRIKKEEYLENAKPGMLYNTITDKLYNTPLRFVVGKFERYYMEWKPNRGGLAGIHSVELIESRIGQDILADDGFKLVCTKTGNEFSDTYVYYVLLPDHMEDGVCILSLTSSSLKEAKKLNRNLRSTMIPNSQQRALPFFMIWKFNAQDMKNDKGEWVGPKFTFDSFVNQEQLTYVQEERKELPNKNIDLKLIEQDGGSKEAHGNAGNYGEVKY